MPTTHHSPLTTDHSPLLAVTMGDPAGIGAEIIVRAWGQPGVHESSRLLVVGHPEIFRRAVHLFGSGQTVVEVDLPEEAEPSAGVIPCLRSGNDEALAAPVGEIDPRSGQAAYDAVVLATELALVGRVDGVVTAPLNKAALWAAGYRYPGHTELLAELCGVDDFAMMLYLAGSPASSALGVVHATLHTALRDVFGQLSTDAILAKCHLADTAMRQLNGSPPRIGVCALNPHAGEQGLFGDEEVRIIAPGVELARQAGLDVAGPLPADTLMMQARDGAFDAVVAMYHDQGHIALKLLDMYRAVNVTLGLPIVRTSVAHGTAFDLAWQGRADERSMVEALRVAATLARVAASQPSPISAHG